MHFPFKRNHWERMIISSECMFRAQPCYDVLNDGWFKSSDQAQSKCLVFSTVYSSASHNLTDTKKKPMRIVLLPFLVLACFLVFFYSCNQYTGESLSSLICVLVLESGGWLQQLLHVHLRPTYMITRKRYSSLRISLKLLIVLQNMEWS